MRKSCAATLRRGLLSISLPGANQRVHGSDLSGRGKRAIRFRSEGKTIAAKVRPLPARFPQGRLHNSRAIDENAVCELRASRQVFASQANLLAALAIEETPIGNVPRSQISWKGHAVNRRKLHALDAGV